MACKLFYLATPQKEEHITYTRRFRDKCVTPQTYALLSSLSVYPPPIHVAGVSYYPTIEHGYVPLLEAVG